MVARLLFIGALLALLDTIEAVSPYCAPDFQAWCDGPGCGHESFCGGYCAHCSGWGCTACGDCLAKCVTGSVTVNGIVYPPCASWPADFNQTRDCPAPPSAPPDPPTHPPPDPPAPPPSWLDQNMPIVIVAGVGGLMILLGSLLFGVAVSCLLNTSKPNAADAYNYSTSKKAQKAQPDPRTGGEIELKQVTIADHI